MSGHKHATISISQEEYQRLHDAEMSLRMMESRQARDQGSIAKETLSSMDAYYRMMETRQADFIQDISLVSQELGILEEQTSLSLVNQRLSMQETFEQALIENNVLAAAQIADTDRSLRLEMEDVIQQRDHALEELYTLYNNIKHDQEQKQEAVQKWLDSARIIEFTISRDFEPEKFIPGEFPKLRRQLRQAQALLAQGFCEASLALGVGVYTGLSDFRIQLEQMRADYEILFQSALHELHRLYDIAKNSRIIPAISLDGKLLDQEISVDYWVKGQVSQVLQELESLLSRLTDTPLSLTTYQLTELTHNTLPGIYHKLDELTHKARLLSLNSQLRLNIADYVVDILEGQGYSLIDSSYLQEDMRDGYYAKVGNLDGSEIVIQVSPEADQDITNQLHLYSNDREERTVHELKQRALEIKRALKESGLEVGKYFMDTTPGRSSDTPPIFQNGQRRFQLQQHDQAGTI